MKQPAHPPTPPTSALPPADPLRLWPALEPSRQRQLAQCLAILLRRLPPGEAAAAKEVADERAR